MLLSYDAENDINSSEASELPISSGYEMTGSSNKSTQQHNRVSLQEIAMAVRGTKCLL